MGLRSVSSNIPPQASSLRQNLSTLSVDWMSKVNQKKTPHHTKQHRQVQQQSTAIIYNKNVGMCCLRANLSRSTDHNSTTKEYMPGSENKLHELTTGNHRNIPIASLSNIRQRWKCVTISCIARIIAWAPSMQWCAILHTIDYFLLIFIQCFRK